MRNKQNQITNNREQITKGREQITNNREQITKGRNQLTKGRGLFALLAVIYYLLFVFSACNNFFDPLKVQTPAKNGYGRISIIFGEDGAPLFEAPLQEERTVLPSTVFDKYEYTFTKEGEEEGEIRKPDTDGLFTLEVGSYTVEVKAYIGVAESYTLAASGVSEVFSIGSGSNAPVKVKLTRVYTQEPGKFKYTITYPESAEAEITLKKWLDMSAITLTPENLTDGNGISETLELPAGSYLLTVIVKKDGLYAGKNEAVHVYPLIVTEYTKAFDESGLLAAIPPTLNAGGTALMTGVWEDGDVSANSDQWFRFIAADSQQYLHAGFGTLNPSYGLFVHVYDSTGSTVGDRENLNSGNTYIYIPSVTSGQAYYVRVTPYDSDYSGTYRIALNTSYTPPSPTITLTAGVWADGAVSVYSEQWFKFTATANEQYLYAGFDTLTNLYIQLYDSTGSTVVDWTHLDSSNTYIYTSSVTSGQKYYIKVTPYSSYSGTYRIAFNASSTPPLPGNDAPVTTLIDSLWENGAVSANGEQWFKFTATANTQHLHVDFGTLTSLYVQLYDSTGSTVGDRTNLSGSNTYTPRSVTTGQVYYIKVTPYDSGSGGTYRIVFNTSSTLPSSIITLTADTWENGTILSSSSEQSFKFTATANEQYLHVGFGTLTNLYVQVYDSSGTVGDRINLSGNTTYTSLSVTDGQEYYIKVTPSGYYSSGTYRIAFNTSSTPPLPGNNAPVTTLIPGVWENGAVSANGEQWFKFTATGDRRYIHAGFGTLTSLYVQVYDSSGSTVGDRTNLNSSNTYTDRSVTSGQVYYIKVTPYDSGSSGTYRIALAWYYTPPSPTTITLTADTWENGTILSSYGEQSFKFTATASTQYIHAGFGTLTSLYVQVYDSSGSTVEDSTYLTSSNTYTSLSVTEGQEYYIKVTAYSSYTGTYRIVFNTSATSPLPGNNAPVTILIPGVWGNGTVSANGEQWFKFTAITDSQYLHIDFKTLTSLYVQLYDSTGSTVGDRTNLSGSNTNTGRSVTSGQVYYVRITPYDSGYSGTYRIALGTSSTTPSPTITLTADTWADGAISTYGEQCFKFTATASTQYIHAGFGTLTSLYAQLYDSTGSTVGDRRNLNDSNTYTSWSVTDGKVYYIRVTPYNYYSSGTYRIAFNTSPTPPLPGNDAPVTTLIPGAWENGAVSANGEQWFKFTAIASSQYLHVGFDTLTRLYVQVYDSNGSTVGNQENLYSSNTYTSWSVTEGQVYYIKVTPYDSGYSGTYRIALGRSSTPPSPTITLTAGIWADGAIPTYSGVQCFKFTATASEQYLHAGFGTLTDLYVRLYDSTGSMVEDLANLNSSNTYASRPVTDGQVYYIRVTPSDNYSSGTYRIAFNTSSTPPLPSSNAPVTTLIPGAWENGIVSANGEQWFKFTATASTQYIHAGFDTLTNLYVQVYDSSGMVENQGNLYSSYTYTSRSTTSGQVYYVKVTPYDSGHSGTYRIAFNTSSTPPSPTITLTADTWANGEVSYYNQQCFKFTATANKQYLHVSFGTLTNLYIQVYDLDGNTVGDQTNLSGSTKLISPTVTDGQEYFIKVTPYSSSGTYRIAFNTTKMPPITATLIADTWADGNTLSSSDEQWFEFTATADTQYIYVDFGTLTNLYIQLYDSAGTTDESKANLSSSIRYTSLSVTAGEVYYIKVWPYNSSYTGTYRITFNAIWSPPGVSTLTADIWADRDLPSNGEQWFKFTANASNHIHADFGTLNSSYGVNIQLYNSNGTTIGLPIRLYNGSKHVILSSVTNGQVYFIKVTPYSSGSSYSGTYRIALNDTWLPPGFVTLTADTWENGNIPSSSGEQWFKFIATDTTQYLYVGFGTLINLYVQVFDLNGNSVESQTNLSKSSSGNISTSRSVVTGQGYYIKVTPYSSSYSGTYRIAFNATWSPPDAATLTVSNWTNGNIPTSYDEQWFSFTATNSTQYIHASFGTLTDLKVQVYNSSGNRVGNETNLYESTKHTPALSVIKEQVYYIKVWPYSDIYSGTYKITFHVSPTAPPQ